jgi:hypothetical protein
LVVVAAVGRRFDNNSDNSFRSENIQSGDECHVVLLLHTGPL